jgi:hypothetical protein
MTLTVELIREKRTKWSQGFGGGMIQFDNAYFKAVNQGKPEAEAVRLGAEALLDAYTEFLITTGGK